MEADDEEDGFFGSAYDAAKDGSRRQIGKHGRSVRQSVERALAEGTVTPDLGGTATTEQVGRAVARSLSPATASPAPSHV